MGSNVCQDKGEVSHCLTLAGFFHFGISFHAFIRYSSCRREGRAQNRRAEGGGNCQGGTQGAAVDGRFGRLMVVVCSVYLERWDRFCLITMFVCIWIHCAGVTGSKIRPAPINRYTHPGLRPFIGLSVYRRRPPLGPARLSVYRFIGAATPPVRPHGLRPLIGLSVYRRRPPLGPARLSVYRFIGAATPSARPHARQARPPPWAYPVHRFIEERILLEKSCMYKF